MLADDISINKLVTKYKYINSLKHFMIYQKFYYISEMLCCNSKFSRCLKWLWIHIYLATANRTWFPVTNPPGSTCWSLTEFFCCYRDSLSAVFFVNGCAKRWIHTNDDPLPDSVPTCNRTLTTEQSLDVSAIPMLSN